MTKHSIGWASLLLVLTGVACSRERSAGAIVSEPLTDAGVHSVADATVEAPPDGPQAEGCPAGLPGPKLVRLTGPDGGAYCMDQREVTAGEYAVFVKAAAAKVVAQPAGCDWNGQYEPLLIPPHDPEMTDMTGYCLAEQYDPVNHPNRAVFGDGATLSPPGRRVRKLARLGYRVPRLDAELVVRDVGAAVARIRAVLGV